ncbi:hypothetical protein GXW83_13765 [Streptacidiphilus sp. PB12-B1b]|uniref:hypothetical protein n=1 Tax=Streptacidiphilus sp. PB12-B1b TaxID=2705012 RepID=UPI0015FB9544|nr:hypothetical protein [Streptacidiphilus sp. PB12-B1b]QMU76654.1 hypothetical protein GXW83_13765 [Streptacidiphilus sp. PB12-B1b]
MHADAPEPNWTNQSGIVNQNSPNNGNMAAGSNNRIVQTIAPASPSTLPEEVTLADLRAVLEEVRQSLTRLRADAPDAIAEEDAEDAEEHLARVEAETGKDSPGAGVIRRRVSMVVDALAAVTSVASGGGALATTATALVGSLAQLQAVVLKLFGG